MDKKISTAIKIIKKIEYMNISSITPEGLPWNSPVYCGYGDSDIKGNFIDVREEIDLKGMKEHLNHSPPA